MTGRTYNGTTATLSYDNLNHFTEWNAGATNQEWYMYDGAGQRVLRRSTNGSTTSLTVYAFGQEEHSYTSTGSNEGNTYYYTLAGHLLGKSDGGSVTFYQTDLLGSVVADLSNTAGSAALKGNEVYGPYGKQRYNQGTHGTPKGFTGQYNDALTGLDYYTTRYYDPVVGVFLSADSTQGNMAGMNPYAYVKGNPETDTDPSGQYVAGPPGSGLTYYTGSPYYEQWGVAYSVQTGQPYNGNGFSNGWLPGQGPNALPKPTTDKVTLLNMCSQNPRCAAAFRDLHNRITQAYLSAEFGILTSVLGIVAGLVMDNPELMQQDEEDLQKLSDLGVEGEVFANALGCSFTSETLVRTKHALQPIGKVHIGDKVLAYNPKTRKMEWQSILHVWIHTDNDLVDLTITTTTPAQHGRPATRTSEVIHTNKKHPFFTLERGFLPVGQVRVGMHVLRADGRVGVVTGWKIAPGVKMMYNLEVAQDHTFTVGDGQWVVHNCDTSGLANREAQDQVTRLQHTFSEQLDESSLSGAWKELQGESSGYWEKQQRPIQHLQKVENALNGAERRVANLQKLVDQGILSESDQCIVQCVINQAGTFIDYVYNTIFSDAWSPGIPPPFP